MTTSHTPLDAFDIYALLPKRKPQKYKGESDEDFNKYKKDLDKAHRNRDSSLIISIRNERRAKINASAVQKKSIKRRQLRQQQIHQREQRRLQQQQSNPQLPHLPVNHQPPNQNAETIPNEHNNKHNKTEKRQKKQRQQKKESQQLSAPVLVVNDDFMNKKRAEGCG